MKVTHREKTIDSLSKRDGYKCYLDFLFNCGGEFTEENGPTIDHVEALANGGTWDPRNLKLAHLKCNQTKADRKWIAPGVLEDRPRTKNLRTRRFDKQQVLDGFCELCYDGRLLMPSETCPECQHTAVAFPWSTKMEPKECSHSGVYWCWACSIGIYQREPAIVTVLDGSIQGE